MPEPENWPRADCPVAAISKCCVAVLLGALLSPSGIAEPLEEQALAAVQRGDAAELRAVLAKQPDMTSRPIATALSAAMAKSDDTFAKALIEAGANPADVSDGGPAWYRAIAARNLSLMSWILERGILSARTSRTDVGPVNVAASSFWPEGIKRLIEAGAALDIVDGEGNTALLRLAARPEWEAWRDDELASAARALVSAGADPRRTNRQNLSAADLAWGGASLALLQVVDLDQKYRARQDEIRQRDLDQRLRAAIRRHQSSRVRWAGPPPNPPLDLKSKIAELIANGASPYALPANPTCDFTGFELALGAGDFGGEPDSALVQMLLTKPVQAANTRISPLVIAARRPEIVRQLLAVGVSVDARYPESQLALVQQRSRAPMANAVAADIGVIHGAAATGAPEALEALVQAGARPDRPAADGRTPLHFAIGHQKLGNAEMLLRLGANLHLKDNAGRDAVDLAAAGFAISFLRKIDRDGRYRTLLDEFPVAANSPRLGRWTGSEGPGTFVGSLDLRADGGGAYNGLELGWRDEGDSIVFKSALQFAMPGRVTPPMMWAAEVEPAGDWMKLAFPGAGRQLRFFRAPPAVLPDLAGPSQKEIERAQSRVLEHAGAQLIGPEIASIPENVFQLGRCESIEIVSTNIRVLPGRIGELKCLTRLSLHGNPTAELELGLARATDLTEVHLQENRLSSLPADLPTLSRLRVLVAYGNQLTSLPEGWEQSRSLHNLAVGQNQLRELPRSLGRAPALKWLQVQANQLAALPDSLAESSLESLNLARNRFSRVPEVVFRLRALQELDLSQNPLSGDIRRLRECAQLRKLSLVSTGVTEFPDFRTLPLRSLDLSNNKLGGWPADPAMLPPTLEELVLRDCGLSQIPPWVETLALNRLDLFGNDLPNERIYEVTAKVRRNWDEKQRAFRANGKARP